MKRLLAILMAMMCLFSAACAEESKIDDLKSWFTEDVVTPVSEMFAEETIITTVGSSEPASPIDTAIISFSMAASGKTVAEANDVIIANITKLQEALVAQGVAEKDIWHKSYDVFPNMVYHNTRVTERAVIDGYVVEIVLNVKLEDISLVGVVIDAVMNSGSESTPELILEQSQAPIAYETALLQAAQQAMEKASHLAINLGLKLDQLLSVTELSTFGDEEARVEVRYSVK